VLRFVRKKRYLPDVEGDLSAWIFAAHGFTEKESGAEESGAEDLDPNKQKDLIEASAEFTNRWFGPGMDAQRAERSITRTREIMDTRAQRIAREYRSGNLKRYETLTSEAMAEMLKELRTPRRLFQPHGLSIEQFARFRRATRATLICLALHNEYPLVLIARAAKGDRLAVLSLVKTDKLFLHDRCCAPTIRSAELRDDRAFMMQLKRAMEYQSTLRRRDALQVYYYILLLLESWGFPLPTLNELWSTLDPQRTEYKSLSAFEKDCQRRRRDFAECSERLMKRSPYVRSLPPPSEKANGLAFNCARPLPPPLTGSWCNGDTTPTENRGEIRLPSRDPKREATDPRLAALSRQGLRINLRFFRSTTTSSNSLKKSMPSMPSIFCPKLFEKSFMSITTI